MTEWKVIQGYPHFMISNEGQIKFKGDADNPEMDWPIWKNGTTTIRDENGKSSKPLCIHRLVAEHFVECNLTDKPRDGYYVKHIDGDKNNNRADNLYWSNSPHKLSMKQKIPRKPKSIVTIRDNEKRLSIVVYTHLNGKTREKEFRYKRIGKEAAMEKATEYVKNFKEEHNIED